MSDRPEDHRTEIALFRYTLILSLVRGQYPPRGKGRLRQQIAAGHYDIPYSSRHTVSTVTLARWERRYQEQGFEGLKPQPRYDKGQPRTISTRTLDRAEALKREQPHRSARSVAHILSLDPNVYAVVYLANPHLRVAVLYHQILLALQVEPASSLNSATPSTTLRAEPQDEAWLAKAATSC